ncbi:MAG: FecR domain-containing protein [Gammaproteobacteria bacterium]|nr:FecR domain-containing protein [Gammaproteobacteria bacterium]
MASRNRILGFTRRELLQEQAAAWVVRLENGPLTPDEARSLREWAGRSDYHRRILLETARVWDRMEVLAGLSEVLSLENPVPRRAVLGRMVLPALAAGLAMLGIALFMRPPAVPGTIPAAVTAAVLRPAGPQIHETRIGANDVVQLGDGTVINLNTATRIQVEISPSRRSILLLQGEAYFDVARDEQAPFVVTVDGTEISAMGTAFSVQKLGDSVEVTVAEGLVQVKRDNASFPGDPAARFEPVMLRAGQVAQFSKPGVEEVREIEPQAIARKLLWQQKILAFDGNTLQEVVDEYSRYTPLKIRIADAETAAIRVGGYFRSDNIAGLLTSLKQNFAIEVRQIGADSFELQRVARAH